MPYFSAPFTINNGDVASASYLTNMVQVSSYASGSMVIIGNSAGSGNSPLVEITIGNGLALSTGSVISVSSTLAITGTLSVTGSATMGSAVIGTALPITSGGTGASSTAAANQTLTAATVTVSESTGAATINWASGSNFYLVLNANCTLTFSNAADGQIITLLILNTASNYTVTWPTIKWQGAVTPTMTTGVHYDLYNIVYNATVSAYFGSYVQNY